MIGERSRRIRLAKFSIYENGLTDFHPSFFFPCKENCFDSFIDSLKTQRERESNRNVFFCLK